MIWWLIQDLLAVQQAFLDAFSAWLALYSWPSYLPWLP